MIHSKYWSSLSPDDVSESSEHWIDSFEYIFMVFQLTFGGKLTNAEMKNAASKIKIEKKVLIIEERFEKFVWWRADEHKTATNTSRLTLDWAFLYFTQFEIRWFFLEQNNRSPQMNIDIFGAFFTFSLTHTAWVILISQYKEGAKYDYVHLRTPIKRKFVSHVWKYSYRVRIWFDL